MLVLELILTRYSLVIGSDSPGIRLGIRLNPLNNWDWSDLSNLLVKL